MHANNSIIILLEQSKMLIIIKYYRMRITATCLYGSDRQKTLCNLFQRRNFIIQMLQAYILSIVT